jgi:hypothetical protein
MAINRDAMNELSNAPGSETDGTDLFLQRLTKDAPKELSGELDEDKQRRREPAPADNDQTDDQDRLPEDADEPSEEGEKDTSKDDRLWLEDDESKVYTKVKVGDEEHDVSVKDLKRLFGQDAALTQRSMQIAETRKRLEAAETENLASQQLLLLQARNRYQPFSQINFLDMARDPRITKEQYEYLRGEAQRCWEEVEFLEKGSKQLIDAVSQRHQLQMKEVAAATIKELQDPSSPNYIDGWSNDMYNDLRSFAINEGLSKEVVNSIVEAPVVRLLRYAQLYKAGKTATVKTEVKNKQITRVVKTSRNMDAASTRGLSGNKAKAVAKLRRSGEVEDAANVFFQDFRDRQDGQ